MAPKRVAGTRRRPETESSILDGASAAVAIVQSPLDGSIEFRLESFGPMEQDEIIGALELLVEQTRRGTSRAAGLW